MNGNNPYSDIIDMPHHVSRVHPRMPRADRAAQFSPFAALTGYEAVVKETARLTQERVTLDEDAIAELDRRLQIVRDHIAGRPAVSITYFVPDPLKDGGEYVTIDGVVKRFDIISKAVCLADGTKIPVDDIVGVSGEIFTEEEERFD